MVSKKRFLDSLDSEDVYDDVVEKKAMPELILKANILQAQDLMLNTERKVMTNYRFSGAFFKSDEVEFAGTICLLWGFIKQMVIDYGVSKDDVAEYKDILLLERGRSFNLFRLIDLKNFLLKYLHLLNITNLFVSKGSSWYKELESEY